MSQYVDGAADLEDIGRKVRKYERLGQAEKALSAQLKHIERCPSLACRLYEVRLLQMCGKLAQAEATAIRILNASTESMVDRLFADPYVQISSLLLLSRIRAERGRSAQRLELEAEALLDGYRNEVRAKYLRRQLEINRYLAVLRAREFKQASEIATRIFEASAARRDDRALVADRVRMAEAAMGLEEQPFAHALLQTTRNLARSQHSVWLDTRRLVLLGDMYAIENADEALRVLERAVPFAKPYPALEAAAWNAIAKAQARSGAIEEAANASIRAFRAAWCEGPPFSNCRQLQAARTRLANLKVAEPLGLPQFDPEDFPELAEESSFEL